MPAIAGVRTARTAHVELRYGSAELQRPNLSIYKRAPRAIRVSVIDVREQAATVPAGEEPIHWLLITTHTIETNAQARQLIDFYCARWIIEQVFRTLKKKGFDLEASQLTSPTKAEKLTVIALAGAIKVMQLVQARDGRSQQSAAVAFNEQEIELLSHLNKKVAGKTEKQQNPFTPNSLSWAAWIIARLGGWKGYASERPPGPITLYRGLERFEAHYQGWLLAKDVCIP